MYILHVYVCVIYILHVYVCICVIYILHIYTYICILLFTKNKTEKILKYHCEIRQHTVYFLLCFCIDARKTLGLQNNSSLDNTEVTETIPGIVEDNYLKHRSTENNRVDLRKCMCL